MTTEGQAGEEEGSATDGGRAARPGRRGAWRGARRSLRAGLLLALAPAGFALAAATLLLGREVPAPSWVRERVEAAAAEALDGGALRFGEVLVTVGRDLHPRVRLIDASLTDAAGRVLARVPEVAATLSPRGLLLERRLLVQEIEVRGATLSLSRQADGGLGLAVGGGAGAAAPAEAPRDRLAALPDRFERAFERPALAALRAVRVEGLVVNYDDARAGRAWTLDGGTLALDLTGGMARLRGEVALLSGRPYVTRARLSYESPRGSPAARVTVALTDVAAADVASQSAALTWLSVVDAPISAALRVELDEAGALGPLRVALKIAEGRLRPAAGMPGLGFDLARATLAYDPATHAIDFDRVEVRSDWGGVSAEGRAYLREVRDGLPRALLAQLTFRDAAVGPRGLFSAPVTIPAATVQARLRLDPFAVDVADLTVEDGQGARLTARGRIAASPEGWEVALDARLPGIGHDRLLALWPEGARPQLRAWLAANLAAGRLTDATGALRLAPGRPVVAALAAGFEGVSLRPLATHPPVTGAAGWLALEAGGVALGLERGTVAAPEGGVVDVAGTTFSLPGGGGGRPPARVGLRARGSITAALSLLDVAPYALLASAGQPVALAEGTAEVAGSIDLRLGSMREGELRYDLAATLRDVRSDVVVPGRVMAAEALAVAATPEGISIGGDLRLGSAPATGTWRLGFADAGRSRAEASVSVTPAVLEEFGIALPDGAVRGEGRAEVALDLASGAAPAFSVRLDLVGLALSVPEVGWSKAAGQGGALEVEGRLGSPVTVEALALSAPGLAVEGDLDLASDGSLERLSLSSARVGGWFDGPVTLRGRGGDAALGVEVTGGALDLGRATFGGGGGGGGPISVALDRLQVTEGIALTGFRGEFSAAAGLEGEFVGQVNGGPTVTGRVAPQGGRVAARVRGEDAGAVMRAADLFTRAEGGALDLLLLPVGEASYDGEAWITGLRVVDAPVLASLLNAVSVVGLLQQLGGTGILFDQVAAEFRIDPTRVTLTRSSAVGAAIGLSLEGGFDTEAYRMDFRGVLSPLYVLNGIGQIFARPGEGLLGFNFTLSGSPDDPQVGVNPLSVLAPGLFRDALRSRREEAGG